MTPREVLDLPIGDTYTGATTVRGYLVALLATLWDAGEGFSGKRPFGDSSWEYDLYIPLAKAGLIRMELDDDDCPTTFTREEKDRANKLIRDAIYCLEHP